MLYSPNNFAKDPAVIHFGGRYFLYHSAYAKDDKRLRIGIAVSDDMENWELTGYLPLDTEYEKNGNGAPSAIVLDGKVHLFYQTYGNGRDDAICHAVSEDGFNFIKDPTNPVYHPDKSWCCGRAIDADIAVKDGRLWLYYASRDFDFKIQIIGVASAPIDSVFSRNDFRPECDAPIMKPELDWEGECIEAPATIVKGGKMWMFYGGAYNCHPQLIGLCCSEDCVHFTRFSDKPFYINGKEGDWNASESGHPYVFEDDDGKIWLFFQGSPDGGKHWIISRMEIKFNGNGFDIIHVYDK